VDALGGLIVQKLNNMKKEDLIIGTRYYLDSVKDCSGVFIGLNHLGHIQYNQLTGRIGGYLVDDGIITFSTCSTITEVINPQTAIKD
jgi:hypothetical protein